MSISLSSVITFSYVFILTLLVQVPAFGHSIAGKRFFPTTFQIEDPAPADEFSLLGERRKFRNETGGLTRSTSYEAEYSKRITEDLGLTISEAYQDLNGDDSGFGNLEVGAKYRVALSEKHEFLLSLGIADEIGGTGNSRVSEEYSTLSPALFFGKGFGDCGGQLSLLRPLAVTGVLAAHVPTRSSSSSVNSETGDLQITRNPTILSWGLSLQYSLLYLQSSVRDLGLPRPLDRVVLIVEAPLETCLNRGCDGKTTGTVNPGLVWVGKRTELGIAAQVPINQNSGKRIGGLALFHIFLDDLFPRSAGRPLIPWTP